MYEHPADLALAPFSIDVVLLCVNAAFKTASGSLGDGHYTSVW